MQHPKVNNKLLLTFISDTHGTEPKLPGGDILIHCGDLTVNGYKSEIIQQLNYLHEQLEKYKYVILIPGNHDWWAERHPKEFKKACLQGNLISLINEETNVMGIKFWGSPATPWYHSWAFNYLPDPIKALWQKIPSETDIVLTHGPLYGILDLNILGIKLGCPLLFDRIQEVKPKIHAFGHVHENWGIGENDHTLFINCATKVIQVEYSEKEINYSIIS